MIETGVAVVATVRIVRHGEAQAGFGAHKDPGLSELGIAQAKKTARSLAALVPQSILTSPLCRARETAAELAVLWQKEPLVDERFAEVPTPIEDLADRASWLTTIMRGTWQQLPVELKVWRNTMIEAAINMQNDCIVFSHYVAINILVGAASGKDELITFRPDNASVTVFSNEGGQLKLLSLGAQASTRVN